MKKRGQAEILITVLLVIIVLAGIAVVGVFIKKSVVKSTLEAETQLQVQTMNLKFDIKYAFINRSENKTLLVSVFRESGSQEPINALKFLIFDKNGKSYSYVDTSTASEHKALETKIYTIRAVDIGISSFANITRVLVYYGTNSSSGLFVFSSLLDEYGYNVITKEGSLSENFGDEILFAVNVSQDLVPPGHISNLNAIYAGESWIYWNWTNPSDLDFYQNIITLDGTNIVNTSNNYYNATGLVSNRTYNISIKTKDILGNLNNTLITNITKTLAGTIILLPLPNCGNNIVEPGEACDGSDLNGYTCASVAAGFKSGSLSCNGDCKSYDVDNCVAGNIINADSCSQEDVQAAVNNAIDGDTVQVPAGTCHWVNRTTRIAVLYGYMNVYSPVFINKSIILKGAGQDETIIIDDTSYNSLHSTRALHIHMPADKPVRITGFTFEGGDADCSIVVYGTRNFRMDHLRLTNLSTRGACAGNDRTMAYGLFDHIDCDSYNMSECFGVVLGDNNWDKPLIQGTAEAVYMENIFINFIKTGTSLPVVDCRSAGRLVFRNSYVKNGRVGGHGTCETNFHGCSSALVYENTFLVDGTTYTSFFGSRGGTSIVYNNTISTMNGGAIWNNFQLSEYRTCHDKNNNCDYWGGCNGTNPLDGNLKDAGYPCLDQTGRADNQRLMPVFEWQNTKNGADMDFYINDGCSSIYPSVDDHLKKDRDYYEDSVIYNSSTNRYEASYTDDDGSIKQWAYTPYVYPHPLSLINN